MNYLLKANVQLQKVGDETILLDTESGNYYSLDSIGSQMLHEFQSLNSIAAVVDAMTEIYDVPRETIESDMLELWAELEKEGLAEVSDAPKA